jgi:hypothetical protein
MLLDPFTPITADAVDGLTLAARATSFNVTGRLRMLLV